MSYSCHTLNIPLSLVSLICNFKEVCQYIELTLKHHAFLVKMKLLPFLALNYRNHTSFLLWFCCIAHCVNLTPVFMINLKRIRLLSL